MLYLGVDIGSSATKAVAVDEGASMVAWRSVDLGTGTGGVQTVMAALLADERVRGEPAGRAVATGYGRMRFADGGPQKSEISCHAKGVFRLHGGARTVVDIGGQDVKVIRLKENGMIAQFLMNDKCAAGTGRFLEMMSRVLDIPLSQLEQADARAVEIAEISSTCTVFAESEVISKLSSGVPIESIVAGIHQSVAKKAASLLQRIGPEEDIVFTGGVAKNGGVVRALERELRRRLIVPELPQLMGAYGAALFALEEDRKERPARTDHMAT